jgi:hypothetical protein
MNALALFPPYSDGHKLLVTLEVYGVSACKDFPQGTIAYTGVSLAHDKSTLHPKWQKESQNACQEKVEVLSESSINLKF